MESYRSDSGGYVLAFKDLNAHDGFELSVLKDHLRIAHTDADTELTRLGKLAVEWVERMTGYSVRQIQITQSVKCFPDDVHPLRLMRIPFVSLDEVKYWDEANAEQTKPVGDFVVQGSDNQPAWIIPGYDDHWPTTYYRRPFGAEIKFTSGYSTEANVPELLRHLILLKAGEYYLNRGDDKHMDPNIEKSIEVLRKSVGWGHYAGSY